MKTVSRLIFTTDLDNDVVAEDNHMTSVDNDRVTQDTTNDINLDTSIQLNLSKPFNFVHVSNFTRM